MIQLIKTLLLKIVNDLDNGNSNLTEKEESELLNMLIQLSNKENKLSKYQACKYLNISRAPFDNYIKLGKLPKGQKEQGFKELFWLKKDLDKFKK